MVGLGFTPKYLSKGMKSFLNSEPLSNRTFLGLGYLFIQIWLNSLEIQAEDFVIHDDSAILNHPVLGPINIMDVKGALLEHPWYLVVDFLLYIGL